MRLLKAFAKAIIEVSFVITVVVLSSLGGLGVIAAVLVLATWFNWEG